MISKNWGAQFRTAGWLIRARVLSLLLLALFLLVWSLLTSKDEPTAFDVKSRDSSPTRILAEIEFPTPSMVGAAFVKHGTDLLSNYGNEYQGIGFHLATSLGRVFNGFLLASGLALPFGCLIGMSSLLSQTFNPYINILKAIPPLALMPLVLSLLGNSDISSHLVIAISSMWPILLSAISAMKICRLRWKNSAQTQKGWMLRFLREIYLPIVARGMRVAIGTAWFALITVERISYVNGIGYFVWREWMHLALSNVIVAIVVIGLVGVTLDQIFCAFEKKLSVGNMRSHLALSQ